MEENELIFADRLAEQEREQGIAQARASLVDKEPDFDGEHCVDCGGDMPAARLAMGRARCVHCQSTKETLARRGLAPTARH